MMSGDNERIAAANAGAQESDWRARLLPDDKTAAIESLRVGGPCTRLDGVTGETRIDDALTAIAGESTGRLGNFYWLAGATADGTAFHAGADVAQRLVDCNPRVLATTRMPTSLHLLHPAD